LIITCAECETQFQLEETRVPESGIRVRCSVCKHAFFVPHPDSLEEDGVDPVDRVVGEVLVNEPDGLPVPTEDLGASDPSAGDDRGDAESWEFGDGGRLADPAGDDPRDRFEESFEAAREAVDDLLGSPWQAPEPAATHDPVSGGAGAPEAAEPRFGIDRQAWNDPAPEPAQLDDPWENPAWSNEAPALVSEAPEEIAPAAADAADLETSTSLDLELEETDSSPWWDRDLPESGSPQPPDEASAAGAGAFEIEEAGEADELGEALDAFETAEDGAPGPLGTEPSAAAATPELAISDDWGLDEPGDSEPHADWEAPAPASAERGATMPLPIAFGEPQQPAFPRASVVVAWLRQAGNGVGWGAVAVLASAMLFGSVAPRSSPSSRPRVQAVAGLEATGVEGRWVENEALGALYVVSGELRNPGSETRAPGARLFVRLLDAEGRAVGVAAADVAPRLDVRVLQEAGPEQLRAAGELGGLELARMPVPPGSGLRFEAVVLDLPEAAQRFDLVAAR